MNLSLPHDARPFKRTSLQYPPKIYLPTMTGTSCSCSVELRELDTVFSARFASIINIIA